MIFSEIRALANSNIAKLLLKRSRQLLLAALLILLAVLAGAIIGETDIPIDVVFKALDNKLFGASHSLSLIDQGVIWNYRTPRAIVAACCGMALAVSGVVLQSLLRNALVDPYLMGISAGASTGAVAVMVSGIGGGAVSMSMGAFFGAMTSFILVVSLARAAGGGIGTRSNGVIILAGIAGSQMFNALTAYIITKSANAEAVRGITFWLMGNLSGVRWNDVTLAAPVALVGTLVALFHARALDAFTFGVESAASLGIAVRRVQAVLIAVTALMTAVMVSMVGSIGFVGLVIPHAARFLVGVRHASLLPCAALIGAIFLVAADILSRVMVRGQVLPIGVITALVGAPAFAFILIRGQRNR